MKPTANAFLLCALLYLGLGPASASPFHPESRRGVAEALPVKELDVRQGVAEALPVKELDSRQGVAEVVKTPFE
ncbi:hypothetical protein C8F01DRAFT_1250357 [Mycena amicta]|nr:hypothetical protein C8F01DRAFT_1250357 [Mycena amicta]